jgi:aminoglycoside phosphotransferase (APT) family kinase protein
MTPGQLRVTAQLSTPGRTRASSGWDNQLWRLGEELAVRMPRTPRAPALLCTERRWLPTLAERLSLPVPVPVRAGKPSPQFGKTWTIARWVTGEPADQSPITSPDAADALAEFLRALHGTAPACAPANPVRGIPLAGLQDEFDTCSLLIASFPGAAHVRRVWEQAIAAPAWRQTPVWLHGDLHPANVVVRDGTLCGLIDFGDMCAGDPATDLSAAWLLLPAGTAPRFIGTYANADSATIQRARGWAVLRALHLISIGRNGRLGLPGGKPTWEPAGWAALERVLATA